MPLQLPRLDDRDFRAIADEAIARIPSHTPEWTTWNEADPGVTLLELFAFMAESLLYRADRIPERNRLKFLQLLGVPLAPATPARGLVRFDSARGPLQALTLAAGEELRAGALAFRSTRGLDVLPVEAAVVFKRELANPDPALVTAYEDLYRSFGNGGAAPALALYETVPLEQAPGTDVLQTVDGCLWVALLMRKADLPAAGAGAAALAQAREAVRQALGGRVLTLALALAPRPESVRQLAPASRFTREPPVLGVEMPAERSLGAARRPVWRTLPSSASGDGEQDPVLLEIELPAAAELFDFEDLDPLEAGTGTLPPGFDDSAQASRVLTWLRVRPGDSGGGSALRLLWAGINATRVLQQEPVGPEALGTGTGAPDQSVQLSRGAVVEGSLALRVDGEAWAPTDDLFAAGPEVALIDPRLPGYARGSAPASRVFRLDAEAGTVSFGDGLRGARPPFGALISAEYAVTRGAAGNVPAGALRSGLRLPPGVAVSNPLATWGGLDAETVPMGERMVAAFLRHRDRAVTAEDFRDLALRTPGTALARVDVLPAWVPGDDEPGSVPGAVTLMVVPAADPLHPLAPRPDARVLAAVCAWLDPRRLVTTDVRVTGPRYRGLWISVALSAAPDTALAELRARVRDALQAFLSPLPASEAPPRPGGIDDITAGGWPQRAPVLQAQLLAVVARVPGVLLVSELLVGFDAPTVRAEPRLAFGPLELPEILGVAVEPGEAPTPLAQLKAATQGQAADEPPGPVRLPVPFIPDAC
jgi:hypothetical protein